MCGAEAYIMLKNPKMALCKEHYREFVERKVERTIKRYHMIKENSKILVALSGGKDALAVALSLKNLGYEFECLHINLGIGKYSELSENKAKKQCEYINKNLHVVYLKELVGAGIGERRKNRAPCSYCGMTKRYLMNKFAVDMGFDAIATGHNLDDESAFLLGNLLHWNVDYLSRQGPVLPKGERMAARIKPLYELTNEQIEMYVKLFPVDYVSEKCPHAKGANSILYAKVLNEIETKSPGTKLNFVNGYLKNRDVFKAEEIKLNKCKICGMPTLGDICSFCRFWNMKEEVKFKELR